MITLKKLAVYKKVFGFLTASLIFATAAASCTGKKSSKASEDSSSAIIEEDTTNSSIEADALSSKTISYSELFSQRDLDPSYDSLTADIALKGTSVEIDGDGASADGSVITITKEGVYRFSGTLDDGQIIVNADGAKVQLVFDNADISCSYSAPVYGINSDKIFITLADGSTNSLTDASSYTYEEDTIDEPSAAIFSADSITLNGSGSLTVTANYNDGIRSKDDIVITGGTINITAVSNGIKGKDYVAAAGGDITVTSGGDGIKASNTEDQSLGFVYIEGGTFDITSEGDGIQAETVFYAVDGDFNIVSGGGSANSTKVHTDDMMGGFGGGGFGGGRQNFNGKDFDFGDFDPSEFGNFDPSQMTPPGGMTPNDDPDSETSTDASSLSSGFTQLAFTADAEDSSDDDTSDSTKGIKAGTELNIEGGSYNIDSADDALHSNGDIVISGGECSLDAGDDGIHADSQLDISEGTVSIVNSYEGIEAAIINISGGDVSVYSSDDGFNASDGSSQGAMGTYSSGVELNISGGLVYVNASGDGLDSNGDMIISGGTVIVDGPTNDGNGALDGNNSIIVTGGTIVAAGSSGMAEYPDSESTQYSVSCTFDEDLDGGTLVTLLDSSANEIISFAPSKSFRNMVISSGDIKNGETYTFYIGGTANESDENRYLSAGYNGDGEEAGSFTVSDVTSFVGTQANMMGGGGFGGGMQGGGRMQDRDSGEVPEMPDGAQAPDMSGDMPQTPPGGFGGNTGSDSAEQ